MDAVPALQAVDIHKSFGDVEVLKGISLTAHKGDVVSILGSSGSGKSTFLRCLNFLEMPDRGEVRVAGEVVQIKEKRHGRREAGSLRQIQRVRSKLSMVFQNFNLWQHMSVMQNLIEAPTQVLKVPKAEAMERAAALLHKVGLYERRDYYPNQLSGGQQQRVAIARALAMEPDALLFDEPTSALDYGNVFKTLRLVCELSAQGFAIIMTTHNPDHPLLLAERLPESRVAILDRSGHLQSGSVAAMITGEKLQALYQTDLQLVDVPALQRKVCAIRHL